MVALTLLAWATQTLLHQWGYGQTISPTPLNNPTPASVAIHSAALELRDRVQINTDVVTLRDVCRWSDQDARVFDPLANQVLLRLNGAQSVYKFPANDLHLALQSAGANLANIQISGAAACAIIKGQVPESRITSVMSGEDTAALAQAAEPIATPMPAASTQPVAASTPSPGSQPLAQANETPAQSVPAAAPSTAPAEPAAPVVQSSLKDLLIQDLRNRLALSDKQLEIQFESRDTPTLSLTSPRITFQIDSSGAQHLGNVAWIVTIRNDQSQRVATINARASAWEDQVVLTRSLSSGQAIHANDVEPRRALVEQIQQEKIADASEAVGQVATRSLDRGEVLTAGMISAPRLVQRGDFITVSLQYGQNRIETVARALSAGAKGDSIRATNEATGQIYNVVVTGSGSGTVTGIESSDQDLARINPQAN